MKPIEAELHLKIEKKDEEGELVYDNDGMVVLETVISHGVFADIIVTRDNVHGKMEDNAYALFFEEKENGFTVNLEQLGDIRIANNKMRKYVSSHYGD